MKRFLMTVPIIMLAACETTPQKPYFYTETRPVGQDSYLVQVRGNLDANSYSLENHFHLKAKELCQFRQYDYDTTRKVVGVRNGAELVAQRAVLTGSVQCKQ
jgi:hypothetical protein